MSRILPAVLFLMLLILTGCPVDPAPEFVEGEVEGYKPIYATDTNFEIEFEPARELNNPGKIYSYGQLLLINEKFEGVHIFNNANPERPLPMGFIKIKGNADMAIKNEILYVDHLQDLVAIDISNPSKLKILKRIENILPQNNQFPDQTNVYFECVDPAKGTVIGWEQTIIVDPKCYR
ncbi:MAG: hypothetical protein ACNS62_13710 [Candidatus Cyclobacteriaceae bacterium M3_2C_046]